MGETVKISICMPTTEERDNMKFAALASIFDQTHQDYEVILKVKSETPFTPLVEHGRVQYVYTPDTGIFDATNQAMAAATGDVLSFMGDDDMLAPDALYFVDKALNPYRGVPKWAYGAVEYIGPKGEPLGTRVANRPLGRSRLERGNCLATPAVFWNRAMFEKVGNFRTEFEIADYDMWLQMSVVTNPIYIERTLGYYRVWPGSFSSKTTDETEGYVEKVKRAHGL